MSASTAKRILEQEPSIAKTGQLLAVRLLYCCNVVVVVFIAAARFAVHVICLWCIMRVAKSSDHARTNTFVMVLLERAAWDKVTQSLTLLFSTIFVHFCLLSLSTGPR